ncbi:SanA/YdcF family protein [Vibrio stylophorae]|nr:ElyC/SanA/YdcF family protein [Vibrio stylophorae]
MRYLRPLLITLIVLVILLGLTIFSIDQWMASRAAGRIYDDVAQIPPRGVALVLGTSKYIGRNLNPFYQYRIDAARELYRQRKVDAFLLSGDNAHRSYNEPITMRRDLLAAGIPGDKIHLDYAGFRTLDSIVRAKEVFETNHFVVVSQGFHCERALFIADYKEIDAICLAVPSPDGSAGRKIRIREAFARVKAVLDLYFTDQQPKFLGPKVPIDADGPQTPNTQ